ncbi:hypothetical protein FIBSPDRAFT_1036513 [Athelia psychrophila]|uniref:Sjogrens syndrome scleroderma autoantigen 1 family protein n=1 Tax=Athelia psychrophila TaxID=1759441 RepID=A0A166VMU7_9AGAM|nr:hypothetical protein FIBSPDRAFT_1036513 [Fibularhizoctonia sp. CBS 109695]
MATVIMDVSEKLGQHMLQGWVLTDHPCTTAGCRIPLLRSADDPVKYYCANCDEEKNLPGQIGKQANPAPSASSSSSPPSRSSTPPTEVSSRASSPDFELPPETAESRYRMQQSDTASAEIGRRLLKGWAMLAEECISPGCFGVPLVRPPKAGGDKDPKKECVICGTVYVTQLDHSGFEQLIPLNTSHVDVTPTIPSAESSAPTNTAKGKAKAVEPELFNEAIRGIMSHQEEPQISPYTFGQPPEVPLSRNVIAPPMSQNSSIPPLIMAATSLELSLHALSEKLLIMSNGTMPLDPPSIGITADAIGKVTEALAKVKQLHWSESRVGPA